MEKTFISAQQLLDDSFKLGLKIYESGYRPNYIVGVWRGGAPVGIAVQELLDFLGVESDHIAIRTSSYTGIGERSRHVTVHGLNYMVKRVNAEDSVLIVDDVYDTGLSVQQVVTDLKAACRKNTPDIKIATPYFKPSNNKTDKVPDYFVHETDQWLVFPHELHGLTTEEILEHKPELAVIHDKLLKLREGEND
ncbi:phosphoribosyltransferase family protein [Hahella sp. CR1]|uniref:phosphoribosyltransferase n=1 Tax=Hahella sp. CR1 TaxID=2992807 RepID=UPI0024434F70|nr:phosphoribosyltransferase family protein [Hahella sp. CR1]MDG9672138.1 phosphoribosyltransferase family protein [Hahella sp. CR1]